MGKLFLLQAAYCITGILFFVRDLFAKVPMGQGMLNAFIWPYAQWPLIRDQGLQVLQPAVNYLHTANLIH